jgi:ATP-dependent RNA helicase SUPV3L1/SUV3
VGFAKAGDAWRWRGRRPPQPDRRSTPSHAFAELAKLKKK